MAGYHSRRMSRKYSKRSKRNFFITLILIGILTYATLNWILPNFIGGIGYVKNAIQPPKVKVITTEKNSSLAPPVVNIPYEATNSGQISISGYGSSGSKVKIYLDDEIVSIVDVSSDGTFLTDNIDLNLGTNNIYGKTVDENNKESRASKTISLQYIKDKPNLSLSEPEDNKKIQGGEKKVKITGKTDPGMKVFVNGSQVIVANDGTFASEIGLNDGDNTISVNAQDAAQNTTEIQRTVNYTP